MNRNIKVIEHSNNYDQYHSFTDKSESIKQHGILNQKCGIRRYQNKDGSLTSEGRIHYGVGKAKKKIGNVVEKTKKAIKKFDDDMTRDMKDVDEVVNKISDKMANVFDDNRRKENREKKDLEKRKQIAKENVKNHLYRNSRSKKVDVLDNDRYTNYLDLLEETGSRKKASEEIVKNMIRADLNKEFSRKDFLNSIFGDGKTQSVEKRLQEIDSLVDEHFKEQKYQDMVEYLNTEYSKQHDYLNYDVTGAQTIIRKYIDPDNDKINSSGYRHDHKPIEYMGKYYKNMGDLERSQQRYYFDENGERVNLATRDLSIDPKKKNDNVFGDYRVKRPTYTKDSAVKEAKEISKMMSDYWEKEHESGKVSKKDFDLEKRQAAANKLFFAHPEYYINEHGNLEYNGQLYNNIANLLDDLTEHYKRK